MDVKALEAACDNAKTLAIKLMNVFFSKEQMAIGSCTEVKGRNLLSPEVS